MGEDKGKFLCDIQNEAVNRLFKGNSPPKAHEGLGERIFGLSLFALTMQKKPNSSSYGFLN